MVERTLRLFVDHRLIREIQEDEPWRYEVMHEYLIPMINRSTAKVMDARQRANLKFQRHRLDHQLKQSHRIPLREWWFIRRYSDIERGEPERDLLKKSLHWGLVKASLLALLLVVVTTGGAAWLSLGEVWDEVKLRDGHTAGVRRAAFSPDGRLLVSVGEDKQVIVWDFARRERLATFNDHSDVVTSVAFSPDSKWFATGSNDRTVIVWDTESLKKAAVLRGHPRKIYGVAFSPEGRLLAAAGEESSPPDPCTMLWRVGSWERITELPHGIGEADTLIFSTDSRRLLFHGSAPHTWDPTTAQAVADRFDPVWDGNNMALSPDATRLHTLTLNSRSVSPAR